MLFSIVAFSVWSDEEALLYLTAYCGHSDVVRMLVELRADIDAYYIYRDMLDCVTLLQFDIYKNKLSTVWLLLRMGADPTIFGQWFRATGTPIKVTRMVEMARLLDSLYCLCQKIIEVDRQSQAVYRVWRDGTFSFLYRARLKSGPKLRECCRHGQA